MARKLKTDAWLFGATLVLLATSMAFVYSATAHRAELERHRAEYYLLRHALFVLFGVGTMIVTMRVDYRAWRNQRLVNVLIGATGVALVAVFFAPARNNAHRWLGVGVGGVGIQPSELAKLVAILFSSAAIAARVDSGQSVLPAFGRVAVLVLGFCALIVGEPDMGATLALAAVVGAIVFAAGIPARWLAGLLLTLPVLVYHVVVAEGYRRARIQAFFDPFSVRQGAGFQTVQSLIAVGSGGLLGKGFMQGVQTMFYLPEAHNDFIYAVIAEEKGLLGGSLVLACFVILVYRGLRAAMLAPDAFGTLLAVGITAMIGLQALTNMSVVLNLLPAKGIALPFVSAGGSSMLVSLAAMGILLNISQQASANA